MRGPDARHAHAHVHVRTASAGRRSAREIPEFDAEDTRNLGFLLHMRKKIVKAPYLLLSLFTSLNLCCGKFGQPITDDVSKLTLLKQNIPSDYEIPVHYIPKEVAGRCWVVLNIYPLEQSLRKLSDMFGAISSNKDNIMVFIAMLKSLRFTFDHEELETAMQIFQCHYEEGAFLTNLYFDYINDILNTASEETSSFSCRPPPCLHPHNTPGSHEEGRPKSRAPLLLLLIPITACVTLVLWLVKSKRPLPACNSENNPVPPSDTISSVSISVPLQTLAHAGHRHQAEATLQHQSG